MLVKRTSMYSGRVVEKDLDITQEQCDNYAAGMLLQNAFPNLSASDREFYKTGITDEEWHEIYGPSEEE